MYNSAKRSRLTDEKYGLVLEKRADNLRSVYSHHDSKFVGPDCLNQPDLCEKGFTVAFDAEGLCHLFQSLVMYIPNCTLYVWFDFSHHGSYVLSR